MDGDWDATLTRIAERDEHEGITHTLFLQRDSVSEVHALLVPSQGIPGLWHEQFRVSNQEIAAGNTGRSRKNHAANGDSPTIWLQDDRSEGGKRVAAVAWAWPGAVNILGDTGHGEAGRAKYWLVVDALRATARPASVAAIRALLEGAHPGLDFSDTRENLTLLTVNDANRRHYDRSRRSFRTDMGHPRDLVIRSNVGPNVFYELYDPRLHGVFDVVVDASGQGQVLELGPSGVAAELVAHQAESDEAAAPLDGLDDARSFSLRSIADRRGQSEFRDALIQAYGGRCAITGCVALEVLEAAHIVPHLGLHTQRADNGLLLRSDIHTLFDLGQLWIDEEMRVCIADSLVDSEYAELRGRSLFVPHRAADRPNPAHFALHRQWKSMRGR
jgi:hypothetical protein